MKKYERPCIEINDVKIDFLLAYSEVDIMPGAGDLGDPDWDCKEASVWDDEEY